MTMTNQEAQAAVTQGIQQLIDDPTQWQRWARTQAQFHHYSPGNVLLIGAQRPDATQVAGYRTWQSLDRFVQKGEKGITVLAPVTRKAEDAELATPGGDTTTPRTIVSFRPATVFDISQTAGRPLDIPEARDIVGNQFQGVLHSLITHAIPIPVHFDALEPGTYGVWRPQQGTITISPDSSPDMQLATLLHEWSHSIGHPTGSHFAGHRGTEEVTAETTAYVLSQMVGLDTKSFSQAYVAGWSDMKPEQVKATLADVSHRVRVITATIEQSPDPLLQQLAATWNPIAGARRDRTPEMAER